MGGGSSSNAPQDEDTVSMASSRMPGYVATCGGPQEQMLAQNVMDDIDLQEILTDFEYRSKAMKAKLEKLRIEQE